MKHLMTTLLAVGLAGLVALGAEAQEPGDGLSTREVVDTRLAELKDRLALSDYQWNQVEMILKSSIRERVAIAERYGIDRDPEAAAALEGKDKRAMERELKDSRKDTARRMKRYLDKDQFKEFEAVQEEIHEDFLARIEEA